MIFGRKKKAPATATEEFLQTMRDRFAAAAAAESEIRAEAQKDIEFIAGEQWHPNIKKRREAEDRPALVFNHLPTYVHQVVNEARQNKAQIKFGPVDSGSDVKTAKVLEGMARGIQRRSRADLAYETAVDYSTSCSFGHFRMLTDYCSDESFDLDLRFAPIYDPFSVYGTIIPACFGRKPKFALVVESMDREEFKRQYPKSDLVSSIGFDAGSKLAEGWITDEVRIAEYWYTETKARTFRRAILPDGTRKKVYTDELDKEPDKYKDATFQLGADGLPRERQHDAETIKSCLTNGVEILEDSETTWAGRRIPIYTVLGRQVIVRGKPRLISLVRWMRDPQQLLNIYKTGIAENIGLANRVPYIGYKGQFKDPKWRNANTKNYAYLEAEPVMAGGQIAGLPQRQSYEPAIQALSVAAAQEIDDLKSIAGIFDASLGAQGNETSGIAIERRKQQSGLTNYHYLDNLTRAQTDAGEELGYLIPRIYDTEREVKVIGEDETEEIVRVNAPYTDEKGEQHNYLLDAGEYDVTVEVGPSHSTQRQEAAEQTSAVIQAAPQLMAVIGDILFRNSDNPAAAETAERIKKWISMQMPGLIEDDNQKQQPLPPQVQQQLQQSGQLIDQMTQQIHMLTDEVKTNKMGLDSAERIALAKLALERQKLEAQVLLKQEELGSKAAIVRLQEELDVLRGQVDRSHQLELVDQQAHYQMQAQNQDLDAAAMSQQSDQAHQVGMQGSQQQHAADMGQQGHEQALEQQQAAAPDDDGDEQLAA
jgi:hypothetical protein